MARLQGTVRWFSNAKGYGFLGRDNGPDVFVHYSSIQDAGYKTLREQQVVEFEIVEGFHGKPQAERVVILGGDV